MGLLFIAIEMRKLDPLIECRLSFLFFALNFEYYFHLKTSVSDNLIYLFADLHTEGT